MTTQALPRPAAAAPRRPRKRVRPRPDQILTEAQALALKRAEDAVVKAKKELAGAEDARTALRKEFKPLIPMASDDADRAKGVREITVLGGKIRVTPTVSGKTFSLSKYLAAGGRITATMAKHIGGQKPYDCWTVDVDV
jgi:hypothetical protein